MALLQIGAAAPSFKLPSHDGNQVALQDILGQGPVVVFFYPKDDTSGCTAEACSFRDNYEAFTEAGAQVVGISSDSVASHQAWRQKHRLPFTLLSDSDGTVRQQFGVGKTLGLLPGRVTFVLDKQGIVRHVFDSQFRATAHIPEALTVVRQLRGA